MEVVFASVYFNIHQLPFCMAMHRRLGAKFTYISTESMDADRLVMGFEQLDDKYDFVIKAYDSPEEEEKAYQFIRRADVAIMGSCPEAMLKARLATNKLTLKYSERYFKGGNIWWERLRYFVCAQRYVRPLAVKNGYFLCASAYTAADINKYFDFQERAFKWGYYRDVDTYDICEIQKQKKRNTIIWVGRFLDWKHPEVVIDIARRLKEAGISAKIKMIGVGPMQAQILQDVQQQGLSDAVTLTGAITPAQVREEMKHSAIALFTSDYNEGWGMVVNEAMNACCAVVASRAMGAVPFLITDQYNGRSYEYGDNETAYRCVEELLKNQERAEAMAAAAYATIHDEWNADVATERLLSIINGLLQKEDVTQLYANGPCSMANILL